MKYYTIQNNNLLTAETEQALTRYYNNVCKLPNDYEKDKYIVGEVDQEIDVPDYDEEGNYILTEVDQEIDVPDYDENGNEIGQHTETITKLVLQTHKETIKVQSLVLNPNFEQEKAQKERERLDSLTLTPSDVERALLSAKGWDFEDLKAFLKTKGYTDLQIKAIGIELRANKFYRGAVLAGTNIRIVDSIGTLLGYSIPEDMDYLFQNKELPIKE